MAKSAWVFVTTLVCSTLTASVQLPVTTGHSLWIGALPQAREVSMDCIDARAQESARCHPSLESNPYRYGYAVRVPVNGARYHMLATRSCEVP